MINLLKTICNLFEKVSPWWASEPIFPNRRTAIKTQVEPELLPYSPEEQALIDRFEALSRGCKRSIEKTNPHGWGMLESEMESHEESRRKGVPCKH